MKCSEASIRISEMVRTYTNGDPNDLERLVFRPSYDLGRCPYH